MEDRTITQTAKEFLNNNAAVYTIARGKQYLYIGHTQNIYLRFGVHDIVRENILEDTDIIQIIFCPNKAAACALEQLLIGIHKPLWNGKPGRKGKGSGKLHRKDIKETFRQREDAKVTEKLLALFPKAPKEDLDFRTIDKHLRGVLRRQK